MAAGNPEQKNGEREAGSVVEVVKLFVQMLLERFKLQLTELEYGQKGQLGGKTIELRELLTQAKKQSQQGENDKAKKTLQVLGELFRETKNSAIEFQENRDTARTEEDFKKLLEKKRTVKPDLKNAVDQIQSDLSNKVGELDESVELANEKPEEDRNVDLGIMGERNSREAQQKREAKEQFDREYLDQLNQISQEVGELEQASVGLAGASGIGVFAETKEGDEFLHKLNERRKRIKNIPDAQAHLRGALVGDLYGEFVEQIDAFSPNEVSAITKQLDDLTKQYSRDIQEARSRSREAVDFPGPSAEEEAQYWARVVSGELTPEDVIKKMDWGEKATQMSQQELARHVMGQQLVEDLLKGRYDPEKLKHLNPDIQAKFSRQGKMPRMWGPKAFYDEALEEIGEVRNKESYRAYILKTVREVAETGLASYESANQHRLMAVIALLVDRDVLMDFKDESDPTLSLTNQERESIKGLVESLISVNDFHRAYEGAGGMERVWQMSHKLLYDHWKGVMGYEDQLQMKYTVDDSESEEIEVSLGAASILDLLDYRHFAEKILSHNAETRDGAKREMIAFNLLSQTPEFRNELRRSAGSELLPNFDQLRFERVNGDYTVTFEQTGKSFTIKGLGGDGIFDLDEFERQTLWAANYAVAMAEHQGRLAYHDRRFQGNLKDWHRKIMDKRYAAMYGVAAHPELLDAVDTLYRDVESEMLTKMLGRAINKMAEDNAGSGASKAQIDREKKKLEGALMYLMKDTDNWLMSREQMLQEDNFRKLFIERKVTNWEGKEVGRWDHLLHKYQHEAEHLADEVFSTHYSWEAMIKHFAGDDYDQSRTRGIYGFKQFLEKMNHKSMYDQDNWDERPQKYYDYLYRASNTWKAIYGFTANPNWENLMELKKVGYDWMNNRQKAERFIHAFEVMENLQKFRIRYDEYVTDDNRSLEDVGESEDGRLIYKRRYQYFDHMGRLRGWPTKPDWIEMNEINQLFAQRIIDVEERNEMYGHIEDVLGIGEYARKVPIIKNIWVTDIGAMIYRYTENENNPAFVRALLRPWAGRQWLRWGVGPIIRNIRVFLSYMHWGEVVPETIGELFGELGKVAKETAEQA